MLRRRKIAAGLFMSLVAGLFSLAAPQAPVATANGSTAGWSAVGGGLTGSGNNPRVFSLVRDSAGYLYAGGSFDGRLARVSNSAGATWSTFGSPAISGGTYPWVFSLAVDSATPNNLFVAGGFTNFLRKIDTSTGSNAVTIPTIDSGSDGIEEIAVISDSSVFIGGSIITASAVPNTAGIAMLSGTTFTAVAGGITGAFPSARFVNALTTHAGLLYVGGQFAAVSGSAVTGWRIASFNPTTSAWSPFGSSTSGPYKPSTNRPLVAAIAVQNTSNIFIGGNFEEVRNTGTPVANTRGIAKWDGTNWVSIGTVDGDVIEELRIVGNYLYAGGKFTSIGGVAANNIARLDISSPGNSWEPLRVVCNNGVDGEVRSIIDTGLGDGSVYVGGGFTNAGGIPEADFVAKFTPGASPPCPTNVEALPVLAIPAPGNFRVEKMIGGRNGRLNGMFITLAWDSNSSYYIHKVSVDEVKWDCTGSDCTGPRVLKTDSRFDCWSVSTRCEIFLPFKSNDRTSIGLREARFNLRGFTFDGVGGTAVIDPPKPFETFLEPGPPTDVTATSGWRSVTVTWKEPANQGLLPVMNYLVRSSRGNVCLTRVTVIGGTDHLRCTFTRLIPGVNYTFNVQALNVFGWGEISASSVQAASPKDVQITSQSRKRVLLSFRPGSDVFASGQTYGVPAGTRLGAFIMVDNSGRWEPYPGPTVGADGKFSWRQRLPLNLNRRPISLLFQFEGNNSNPVNLGPAR